MKYNIDIFFYHVKQLLYYKFSIVAVKKNGLKKNV